MKLNGNELGLQVTSEDSAKKPSQRIEEWLQKGGYPCLSQLSNIKFFLDESELSTEDSKLQMIFYKRLYDDNEIEQDPDDLGEDPKDLSLFLHQLCTEFKFICVIPDCIYTSMCV